MEPLIGLVSSDRAYDPDADKSDINKQLFCYAVRAFNGVAVDCLHGFMIGDPIHATETVANGDAKEGVHTTAFFMAGDQSGVPQTQLITAEHPSRHLVDMTGRIEAAQQTMMSAVTAAVDRVQASNEGMAANLERSAAEQAERTQRANADLITRLSDDSRRQSESLIERMHEMHIAGKRTLTDRMMALHREAAKEVRDADQRARVAESQGR